MGWFSRKRASSATAPISTPAASVKAPRATATPLMTTGTCSRLVVGSEHYAPAWRGVRSGEQVSVELVAEPDNPYDPNAVAVHINGRAAGHIGASTAATYQGVVLEANRLGYQVQARGTVEVVTSDVTARLDLAWAEDLARWLRLPADQRASGYRTPPPTRLEVTLKRSGDYQDEMARLLGSQRQTAMGVNLSIEVTGRGKYAGQNLICADVDGILIGTVPAQYRAENESFFAAVESGVTTGKVTLTRNDDDRTFARVAIKNPQTNTPQ